MMLGLAFTLEICVRIPRDQTVETSGIKVTNMQTLANSIVRLVFLCLNYFKPLKFVLIVIDHQIAGLVKW